MGSWLHYIPPHLQRKPIQSHVRQENQRTHPQQAHLLLGPQMENHLKTVQEFHFFMSSERGGEETLNRAAVVALLDNANDQIEGLEGYAW